MVALVKRLVKGAPLTYEEMDGNFEKLDNVLASKVSDFSSTMAIINAIANLRDGVGEDADTLSKLYNFIQALEANKININDVVNDLLHTDINKPLSAFQGKMLRDALTAEINARTNALNTEINNRVNADSMLSTRISNLLSNIDTTALNSLTELVAAFQTADSNLMTAINNLSTNSSSKLTTETERLDSKIDNEINNRQIAINTEVLNRNLAIAQAIEDLESRLYSI